MEVIAGFGWGLLRGGYYGSTMEGQTIISKRTFPIRILIFINCILLERKRRRDRDSQSFGIITAELGHLLMERSRGDLNFLRLGDRSPLSKAYIGIEGATVITLILAVFNYFYPNMKDMVTSKVTLVAVCVVGVEVAIWLFYR